MAVCKLCPARKHCWDKGNCQECDFGKGYFRLGKKIKRLEAKVKEFQVKEDKKEANRVTALAASAIFQIEEMEMTRLRLNNAIKADAIEELEVAVIKTLREYLSYYNASEDVLLGAKMVFDLFREKYPENTADIARRLREDDEV